jgi:diadenosine tetraphosphatase ApaH/serine/threonine PP2A family protein phosphatase
MNGIYGFKSDILALYRDCGCELYDKINLCFNFLPMAALVGQGVLCVHGGITPQISTLGEIRSIARPVDNYDQGVVSDLMWSDPSPETEDFARNFRGNGVLFGVPALKEFMRSAKLTRVIRAHQAVENGVEKFGGDLLYTVFSCSNYQEDKNRCGLIFVKPTEEVQVFSLPMVKQIPRHLALLSGPLEGLVNDDGTQVEMAVMSLARTESVDSAMSKMRINRKASAIGSAIRAHLSLDRINPLVESRRRQTAAPAKLPPL